MLFQRKSNSTGQFTTSTQSIQNDSGIEFGSFLLRLGVKIGHFEPTEKFSAILESTRIRMKWIPIFCTYNELITA